MVSKKKINYHLKLFLPIVAMLWIIIIAFTFILSEKEHSYKVEYITQRLEIINSRVIDLYERGEDPTPYIGFINEYFHGSVLDNVSLTLYDNETGEVITAVGFPAPPPEMLDSEGSLKGVVIAANNNNNFYYVTPDDTFYYNVDVSADGKRLVQTFMPMDESISKEIDGGSWWIIVIAIGCIAVTAVTFMATRHLIRNVKLLREFVTNAVADRDFAALDKFANDDLGEISRQVVNLYNMRKDALASRELEHRIALRAGEEQATLKRQLTNNINHELKTPAGIIKGYIDTIIETPDIDPKSIRNFLLKAQQHIDRLCNILNDLSTMTRLDDGADSITVGKVDFNDFIANFETDITDSGIIGDMKFIVELPDDCIIRGNMSLLTAAFMNLVKNAVAYSKGTEMGIKLLTQNKRFYTFIFYDNGTGVADNEIPMLFERFYRIDKGRSRKSGGTGLGLPIVRSSLNTIGGSISVRNGESSGLEFVFTLRRWKES